MSAAVLLRRGGSLVPPAAQRGYHVQYRGDGNDRCPGCSRQQFHIGRAMVECAFCATAIPLPEVPAHGGGLIRRRVNGRWQ